MIGASRKPTDPAVPGPLPDTGSCVWLENLPTGPAQTQAAEVRDGAVRIDAPRLGGKEIVLAQGTPIALSYQHAQVPCEARAVVIPPPPGCDGGPWLEVRRVERVQRRRSVRVPVLLMARVLGADEEKEAEPCPAVTEDMSANGVLLRLERPLEQGQAVTMVVHLGGDAGDLETVARVVRVERENTPVRPWRVALTFTGLPRGVEDRVVRFLFERQRELRRRETGGA